MDEETGDGFVGMFWIPEGRWIWIIHNWLIGQFFQPSFKVAE